MSKMRNPMALRTEGTAKVSEWFNIFKAPVEMKDALYRVVNQVIQKGKMPTSWEQALTTLIPKKVGEEKILESIRPICLMNTAANIVTSVWAKRLSKSLEQQSVLEGSQEGFRPDRSTRRQIHALLARCRT